MEKEKIPENLSLKNAESMLTTLDYVVQQIALGKMSAKQGDVINTSSKQVLRLFELKRKYLDFYYQVSKKSVDGEAAAIEVASKQLPPFFEDALKKLGVMGKQK